MADENIEPGPLSAGGEPLEQSPAGKRTADELAETRHALDRTTEELGRQQEWFRATLSSIGDAVIATDTAGTVTFLNPVAEKLTGWSPAEAAGRPVTQVLPIFNELTGEPAENPIERVLREGVIVGLANHTVLRSRTGRDIPIEDSAAPIRGEGGDLHGVILVFHDITEKHAREQELRASEARGRAIIDTALDAVLLMDANGKITGWNVAAERIFGWRAEEVMGGDLACRIIPERLREAHYRGLAHLKASGEGPVLGRRIELPAVRRDGTEFPVELFINPLHGAGGDTFVGFIRDISQRKAAEAELADRARLSSLRADVAELLASSNDIDASLRGCCELVVNHLDAAFARIWTVDPNEPVLLLRASAGLYTHVDGPHARVAIGQFKIGRIAQHRRALLTNDVAHDPNISDPEWARREGMTAFAGYPLVADGRLLGVMALFSRQTLSDAVLGDLAPIVDAIAANIVHRDAEQALIAAKERAEVASRAKDNFLAALSHELRTPLTPVLMTATALSDDERLPPEVRADLGMIQRNIALEARLIDDLLDLTAIVKGKLQLREQLCDVHSLIGLATEIVRDEARSKPVTLHLDLAARRTGLLGDPSRLQQVFWNLLRNAIKFTPSQGKVTIRTRDETGNRLRIEVTDTGIGIDPEAIETIFRPFEQAGRENDHRFGGLGLGLAIARAIVDLHGGVITATSNGPGEGATFVIEIPGACEPASGITASFTQDQPTHTESTGGEAHPSRGEGARLRLLVVEDHEPTLMVLQRLLARTGHYVVTAGSIGAALQAAERSPFDVVISDLGLPDGTGVELISKLREIQPRVRGIALSGYGMDDDLRRSKEAGFFTHLVKPVDFDQLRRALREIPAG
jgi:PAS domain S-box-containing protein